MKQSIIVGVIGKSVDGEISEDDIELQFIYDGREDLIEIRLDGVIIAVCNWKHNLKVAFERAIEVFPTMEAKS